MATLVKDAFERLSTSISRDDARDFHSTTLQDVRSAIKRIEQEQSQRQSLRNVRRIDPFLRFMENYSKVIEAGCQGFSPMAWGPVKLMLQLASQYTTVFDKLLEAYKQISEELPRVDRLRRTFGKEEGFDRALGLLYADIVDFHGRAYKFFRRRAWHMMFDSTWRNFEHRFGAIITNLRRHSDLLDREAASMHFASAKDAELALQRQIEETEAQKKRAEWKSVQQWLSVDGAQETRLERLAERCQPGSCNWILHNAVISSWLHEGLSKSIVWVKGHPGSGKSVACSQVVDHLQKLSNIQSAFYFCSYSNQTTDICINIMRNIAAQLLQSKSYLVTYVYRTYVESVWNPSIKRMKNLIREILSGLGACRIVLDGIDECSIEQQKEIISTFLSFQDGASDSCKILFSCRNDESHIKRLLSGKAIIHLRGQTDDAIALYVDHKVDELSHSFEGLEKALLDKIKERVRSEAKGMFLWVRLVFNELENQTTAQELAETLERLPSGLEEAYDRILDRIRTGLSTSERRQALEILNWVCCAMRPLRVREIEDGIAFQHDCAKPSMENRICRNIFDLCGPLIEELPDGSVDTVHFSAKEVDIVSRSHSVLGPDDVEGRIIVSFNGLDHYSYQFWIDHVLVCVEDHANATQSSKLIDLLDELSSLWLHGRPTDQATEQYQYTVDFSSLQNHPAALELMRQVLVFRKKLRIFERDGSSSEGKFSLRLHQHSMLK
ncbi:MAG: hypothetical protein Q9195_005384 [Heterodermia aff. obscurata]